MRHLRVESFARRALSAKRESIAAGRGALSASKARWAAFYLADKMKEGESHSSLVTVAPNKDSVPSNDAHRMFVTALCVLP